MVAIKRKKNAVKSAGKLLNTSKFLFKRLNINSYKTDLKYFKNLEKVQIFNLNFGPQHPSAHGV